MMGLLITVSTILFYVVVVLLINHILVEIYSKLKGGTSTFESLWLDNAENETLKQRVYRQLLIIVLAPVRVFLIAVGRSK